MEWLDALDQTGQACDRNDTYNLVLHKRKLVRADRRWGLTLRKRATVYRTTEYTTRANALKGARRLYDGLMRQQPTGENGHEVDPATGEKVTPCGCIACRGREARSPAGNSENESKEKSPREAVQRWAPVWSAARLKARGWTEAMIRNYLGEPDALIDNPHYRSAAPMRLYHEERCAEAERAEGFSKRKAQARTRSEAGKTAAATRAAKLKEWAGNVEIIWMEPPNDAEEAIRLGTQSWEQWNESKAKDPDLSTRTRWARNYLRHECMSYEQLVYDMRTMPAEREAYATIRERCERMIDARYPDLV